MKRLLLLALLCGCEAPKTEVVTVNVLSLNTYGSCTQLTLSNVTTPDVTYVVKASTGMTAPEVAVWKGAKFEMVVEHPGYPCFWDVKKVRVLH